MSAQKLLSALQDEFIRTEPEPTDLTKSEDTEQSEGTTGTKGVQYVVLSGELQGDWLEWGEGAEEKIFERMIGHLDKAWQVHLERYSRIAVAMRAVGK